jgi:ATP-dependent Clp protease ATP-binding subunit ClpX
MYGYLEEEYNYQEVEKKEIIVKTPYEIKSELDNVVVGQEHAKRVLATEVFKHYLRIKNEDELRSMNKEINKSNILMTGLTGSGKTYLIQQIAKILDIPLAIADCTSLTCAGYVGDDVENVLRVLIQNADYDIEKAEMGIVYLDEFDKLSRKSENPSITRDVSGEGVQQALLKMIEGNIMRVPPQGGRKHPREECIEIDTKNILFMAGGSFEGIEQIVSKRLSAKSGGNTIGFKTSDNIKSKNELSIREIRNSINREDLKKYGMLPEVLGRFSILTNLEPLDKNALINILRLDNGLINEYKTIFELQGKKLTVKEEVFEEIADIAIKENVGARGLRSIVEQCLSDLMFNAPSERKTNYIVDTEFIKENYDNGLESA